MNPCSAAMPPLPRRRKGGYFIQAADRPRPVVARVRQRIHFSDVDPMAILWHGHYARLFEAANEEIGRRVGLSYTAFRDSRLRAPIVQFHVDYFASPLLGEEVTTTGRLFWNDAARMDIEYEVHKENGILAAAGCTVQMFVTETGEPLLATPPLLDLCQARWRAGEFT